MTDSEKIFEISFSIIGFAGEAKSLAFEAIAKAKAGQIEEAKEIMTESRKVINEAHRVQTELIQNEASGKKNDVSVILIHSQDHLMTAMNFQYVADEIIELYQVLVDNKLVKTN